MHWSPGVFNLWLSILETQTSFGQLNITLHPLSKSLCGHLLVVRVEVHSRRVDAEVEELDLRAGDGAGDLANRVLSAS